MVAARRDFCSPGVDMEMSEGVVRGMGVTDDKRGVREDADLIYMSVVAIIMNYIRHMNKRASDCLNKNISRLFLFRTAL